MDQEQYDVDFVHGKKCSNGESEYFVKWVGYKKKDSTWEPPHAFVGVSQQLVIRFERCLDYQIYHSKIYQREAKVNIRVHIMNKGCQVYRKQTIDKQQSTQQEQEANTNGFRGSQILANLNKPDDQEDYDFCLRRGRGRPRKIEKESQFLSIKSDLLEQQRLLRQQQLHPYYASSNSLKNCYVKCEKDYINELLFLAKKKEKKKEKDEPIVVKQYPQSGYRDQETDSPVFNMNNQKYYDATLKCQVSDDKIPIELIQSHHLMLSKQLIFKCTDDEGSILYFDFETLKQFYPTLLLDYIASEALWKK